MTSNIISESERKRIAKKEYNKQYQLANKEKLAKKRIAHGLANKEIIAQRSKKYSLTRKGLVTKIYTNQRLSSKRRAHPMPEYNLEELREWVFACHNFEPMFQEWVRSGRNKMQKPSCDRIDDYQPYRLDNIQLVTWQDNLDRSHADMKNGINNKKSKAVYQIKDGKIIATHHSVSHASRVTGVSRWHISECCNGKTKYARGFCWRFV